MLKTLPNHEITNLFIHSLMKKGKKHTAESLMLKLARILKQKYKQSPLLVISQALENTMPLIGFRSVKLRGSSYKIPYFLKQHDRVKITLGWFLEAAQRSNLNTADSLAKELVQASLKQGDLIKKRDDIHKLGNQSKVFAHYRWF